MERYRGYPVSFPQAALLVSSTQVPQRGFMDVIKLTRALVDIESITGHEKEVALFLETQLRPLAERYGGTLELLEVEPDRFNVFASWGQPVVTLSTHMDTVPPFFPSSEDDEFVWGRGACDAKGVIASMICALEGLLHEGTRNVALLLVVGEERNSAGALHAARNPRGSRYLINGEPTGNKLARGSKGALRYEIEARGRMAHSAYPHLGESAILKLLDVLEELRRLPLPSDPVLGPCTMNIGTITGGRAPNVIPDFARAEVFFRLVDDGAAIRSAVTSAAQGRAEAREVLCVPAVRLRALEGFETDVVAFTTDIPAFGGAWGEPLLFGPGSILVAHTNEERVPKQQLIDATTLYQRMVRQLLNS